MLLTTKGKYCLTGGHDRTVRLWNPTRFDPAHPRLDRRSSDGTSATPVKDIPPALPIQTYSDGYAHPVAAIGVDPDSTVLLAASDRTLVITDVVTAQVKRRLHGHAGRINSVCASAGAETYLSGGYDATVRIWDGRSRSRDAIQTLSEATDSITDVRVVQSDAASEILTSSVDGKIRSYDVRMGRIRIDDLGDAITGLALTRDGQCLAASCLDGSIRLLERSTGELLNVYSGRHVAGNYTLGVDITADDAFVVSGSEDGRAVIYDLAKDDGVVVQELRGHTKATCSVASHPQKEWASVIITASYDGEAVVWANDVDVSRWG